MTARGRAVIAPESVPGFPRGTRFRFDPARKAWIVLAPERLIMPDEVAVEVLKLIDGERTVDVISERLAAQFQAPRAEILADILVLLQELADDGVLEDKGATAPPP